MSSLVTPRVILFNTVHVSRNIAISGLFQDLRPTRVKNLNVATDLSLSIFSGTQLEVSCCRSSLNCFCSISNEPSSSISEVSESALPLPIVIIDQQSDVNATVLEVKFGDRLGALLDTTKALKDLGLNVVRAKVTTKDTVGRNKFVITRSDNNEKVNDTEMLEAIRMTVISNLLQYHPESSTSLASAGLRGYAVQKKQILDMKTTVTVGSHPDGDSRCSVLRIHTADRPGLITEIVDVLTGLSVSVESAEIDTEGPVANDVFFVSYHGEALNKSMKEVTVNALTYFLTHPDIEDEDSY